MEFKKYFHVYTTIQSTRTTKIDIIATGDKMISFVYTNDEDDPGVVIMISYL